MGNKNRTNRISEDIDQSDILGNSQKTSRQTTRQSISIESSSDFDSFRNLLAITASIVKSSP